jgi:HEAT repeat protein
MRASGTCERWVGGITSFAGPRGVGVRTLAGRVMFAEHRPQPDRSDPRRLVIPTYFERADHFFARFVSENGAEVLDRGTGRVLGSIPTSIWEGGKLMLGANHLFLTTTGERLAEREPGGRIVWEALGLPSGLIDVGSVPVRQSGLTYGLDVIRHNPNPDEKTDYLQVKVLFSRLRLGFDDLPGKRVDVRASLPHRIRQLQHPDPVVRGRATDLLVHEMGEAAAPALPALVANYAVYLARRGEAETAWPYYDPFKAIQAVAGKDRVELARKFRTDGRPLVRAGALLLMSNATQCSPDFSSEERFAAAKAALSDPSPDVRRAALEVLRTDTQKQGEEFCRLLLPMLADTVRPTEGSILPATEAARGLACRNAVAPGVEHEIKPQTYERIIKGLCELVGHPNDELAEASLWSLGYVGAVSDRYAAAAVPALSRLLKDTDRPRLQLAGAWSMGALGSKGRPGVPYLMDTLRTDNSVKLRKTICNALMEIGPAASEAVPGLVDLIQTTPLWTEKATYLMVLEEIGPSAKQALQALRKLRESEAAAGNNKNVERIESVMEKIEK